MQQESKRSENRALAGLDPWASAPQAQVTLTIALSIGSILIGIVWIVWALWAASPFGADATLAVVAGVAGGAHVAMAAVLVLRIVLARRSRRKGGQATDTR